MCICVYVYMCICVYACMCTRNQFITHMTDITHTLLRAVSSNFQRRSVCIYVYICLCIYVYMCICARDTRTSCHQNVMSHTWTSRGWRACEPRHTYKCGMDVVGCGSVWLCVAVCCSVLQCVAVCCSVLQCVAVCCSVLQCVAECVYVYEIRMRHVCCSVLQCVAMHCSVCVCTRDTNAACVLQYVVVCSSVLQCVAMCAVCVHVYEAQMRHVCCSMLRCVAVRVYVYTTNVLLHTSRWVLRHINIRKNRTTHTLSLALASNVQFRPQFYSIGTHDTSTSCYMQWHTYECVITHVYYSVSSNVLSCNFGICGHDTSTSCHSECHIWMSHNTRIP